MRLEDPSALVSGYSIVPHNQIHHAFGRCQGATLLINLYNAVQ